MEVLDLSLRKKSLTSSSSHFHRENKTSLSPDDDDVKMESPVKKIQESNLQSPSMENSISKIKKGAKMLKCNGFVSQEIPSPAALSHLFSSGLVVPPPPLSFMDPAKQQTLVDLKMKEQISSLGWHQFLSSWRSHGWAAMSLALSQEVLLKQHQDQVVVNKNNRSPSCTPPISSHLLSRNFLVGNDLLSKELLSKEEKEQRKLSSMMMTNSNCEGIMMKSSVGALSSSLSSSSTTSSPSSSLPQTPSKKYNGSLHKKEQGKYSTPPLKVLETNILV